MRRWMGSWLIVPVLLLMAGTMSVASGYLSRDLAGRDTLVFSTVAPPRLVLVPLTGGVATPSDDEKELVDEGPLSLPESEDSLRPTTIVGGWAPLWGFYHGEPHVRDDFPVGAGPKAPWNHKESRGLPWDDVTSHARADGDRHDLPMPAVKAILDASDLQPPLPRGSIDVETFTVSQAVPTPEPTLGLTLLGLGWLMLRRK